MLPGFTGPAGKDVKADAGHRQSGEHGDDDADE
jgi:hypothetical protein